MASANASVSPRDCSAAIRAVSSDRPSARACVSRSSRCSANSLTVRLTYPRGSPWSRSLRRSFSNEPSLRMLPLHHQRHACGHLPPFLRQFFQAFLSTRRQPVVISATPVHFLSPTAHGSGLLQVMQERVDAALAE